MVGYRAWRNGVLAGSAALVLFFTFLIPIASAHEVYVLSPEMVATDLSMPPLPIFDIIGGHTGQFFFWTFISIWAVFTVLAISLSKGVERMLNPALAALKKYAPFTARITLGLAVVSSGYFGAMFGPELPFSAFLPLSVLPLCKIVLMILGTLIVLGLFTRLAALILIVFYVGMWPHYGSYMLTYANYLGEMVLTLLIGNTSYALDRLFHHRYPSVFARFFAWSEQHAFLILRIAFGMSLIFASSYAKYLHAQLAIDTVVEYNLTNYFPFEPSFIVLGAFAIELLAGIFIALGIEIRFASLFLLFWLTLSLLYFGEAVWPHVVLFGVAITLFLHGYDRYTLQWGLMRMRHKSAREPTL